MANKKMFSSATPGKMAPPATAINEAGGRAYKFPAKHALAQYAATGTFNDTFYTKGTDQLDAVLKLCTEIDPEFVAKTALYSREHGTMKDMPAFLTAFLTSPMAPDQIKARFLAKKIFPRVINNGKMLRNFVQILRSGKMGRKSLATAPTKLVNSWFNSRTDEQIFWQSVGNDPSLGDIIKLAHPAPKTATRRSLYAYLMGKDKVTMRGPDGKMVEGEDLLLPELVLDYERFKKAKAENASTRMALPKVPWEMLEGLNLTEHDWKELAKQASWTQIRMNLNTFSRHGVFNDKDLVKLVADKLKDEELIAKARPFPYQLFSAFLNTEDSSLPSQITNGLQLAVDVAAKNVPTFDGVTYVCVDLSSSMRSPVTGQRAGATTKMDCVHVAGLIASVFLKKNPDSRVLPFDDKNLTVHLNPMDSVMTNASKLAKAGGGGTSCSAPLHLLNQTKAKGDLVLFVSDNESWVDSKTGSTGRYGRGTGMLAEWNIFKARNPKAKLVCIDLAPYDSTQAGDVSGEILNIGGFSDAVFQQIQRFLDGNLSPDHWVGVIEAMNLEVS